MADASDHRRVNDILLGPLERPALQWLAAHMPGWVTPDILSGIGILGALIIGGSYWLSWRDPLFLWLASVGLFINWVGDSLDGTLARYRKIERPKYGFFVDHTVDAFNEMVIILGLGASPYVHFNFAAMTLIGYLLMSTYVYVRTVVDGVFQISYGKFGPTELRAILVILNGVMFFAGVPQVKTPWMTISVYDVLVAAIAAILILLFIGNSWQEARRLAVTDPGKRR